MWKHALLASAVALSWDRVTCSDGGMPIPCGERDSSAYGADAGPQDFTYVGKMEEIEGLVVDPPDWYEGYVAYTRLEDKGLNCYATAERLVVVPCEPIWLICPSEDTGGWDGGDVMRLGGRMMMEIINEQQQILPGYELMCDYFNDACVGKVGQKIVTNRLFNFPAKYAAIGQTGCSGVCQDVGQYAPFVRMPIMSWAAGMPDLTERYPNFPNFFRTRIPHTAFTWAWLKVAEQAGWSKMALVMGEESRFRGHHDLMVKEMGKASVEVAYDVQVLDPEAQAMDVMRTVQSKKLRVMMMVTYETTWRALMCAAYKLGMSGMVWMVYGFYTKTFYTVLTDPPVTCTSEQLKEMAHNSIWVTSIMWSQTPDEPIACDVLDEPTAWRTSPGRVTTNAFKEVYTAKAQEEFEAKLCKGSLGECSTPRDAGAQAVDGACAYARVFSNLLGLSGTTPSGNTYTLQQILERGEDMYEDMNQLMQATDFPGVSGRVRFQCPKYDEIKAAGGEWCDYECRNGPHNECTGDASGPAVVMQFNADAPDSDPSAQVAVKAQYDLLSDVGDNDGWNWQCADCVREPLYFGSRSRRTGAWGRPGIGLAGLEEQTECVPGSHLSPENFCVPDDELLSCPAGKVFSPETESCGNCPPGTAPTYTGDVWQGCFPCQAGWYSTEELLAQGATAKCEPCGTGTFAALEGSTGCSACAAGTVSLAPGAATCEACGGGFYPSEQADACTQCMHGTFSEPGALACTPCDPHADAVEGSDNYSKRTFFTTMTTGASSASACTCKEGTFWNARGDKCEPCRDEAYCPGGLHLPVVYQGKFGRYLPGDATQAQLDAFLVGHAAAQAAKRDGTFGKYSSEERAVMFEDIHVFNCASYLNCPGGSILFDFAEYGLQSKTQEDVRAGYPLQGYCPELRSGIACANCDDSYYGATECLPCSSAASGVNVVILLIFPFVMIALYKGTTSAGTQRLQSAFILVSTCGMAAFFMQTIAVLDTFAFSWPSEIAWLFDISRVFMFDLGGLSLSCMHGNSFTAKYWASILIPVVVVCMTGIGFAITKVLPVPEPWKMRPNQTFSMVGMFMSALYITLVKVVLAYYECPSNPYAPDPENPGEHLGTLAKYKNIVCGSDDHQAAVAPMALGLIVYVVGFYLVFCWAAYTAPEQWANVSFRERWKFMLTRWRPDVWYWGTVVMTRNLLVAFAGVISSEPRVQLVYVVAVVLIALSVTAVYQPWRAPPLNHYDVLSCVMLCGIGILGLIFVSVEEEIWYANRLELLSIAERKTEMRDSFATAMTVMIGLFMALFGVLLCWTIVLLLPQQAQKEALKNAAVCSALHDLLKNRMESPTFVEDARDLIDESTAYDRRGLHNFISKLGVDATSRKSGATDTISVNKAKARTSTQQEQQAQQQQSQQMPEGMVSA